MSTNPKTPGLWTMPKGAFEKSVQQLEAEILRMGGNPVHIFDRFRTDQPFTQKAADFLLRGGIEGSISQRLARAILGRQNFFGLEQWSALFNHRFARKVQRQVDEFPWGEDVLNNPCPFVKGKLIRETHFAFLGLETLTGKPLTILRWHELCPVTGQPKFYFDPNPWYGTEEFAIKLTCRFRWYLMLKEIVPGSTSKTSQEQLAMLPLEYEVPLAVEEVTKDLLYFKLTGAYLNPHHLARCQDTASSGNRVYAGYFDSRGLRVDCWGDSGDYRIGVAASRKIPCLTGRQAS